MPFRFLRNGVRGNSFISDNVSGKTQSYRTRVYGTPVVPAGFTAFVDPQGIVVPASVVRIGPAAPGGTETLIFTSTQPISIPSPITMDYLIVGGGGASSTPVTAATATPIEMVQGTRLCCRCCLRTHSIFGFFSDLTFQN